jgi:hypothetical protein
MIKLFFIGIQFLLTSPNEFIHFLSSERWPEEVGKCQYEE